MTPPTVSVLVLMWNSRSVVRDAVDSILAQSCPPLETLILDNGSSDGGPEDVERTFGDRVRVVRFGENLGYTGGHNRALPLTRGEVLLLCNPDVRLAPDFLEKALPAFDEPRVGTVAGRLVRADGRTVDSSGQFLGRSRKPLDRGYGRPYDPGRDAAGPVLAACGAAPLYRRTMVEDISDGADFFDPDYFAFQEDLEIGWRAWRAGWKAVHVPGAVAIHLRAGGLRQGRMGLAFARSEEVMAYVTRNRWLAMLRHDRLGAVLVDLPFILGRTIGFWGLVLLNRRGAIGRVWRTRAAFGRAWRKRRADRSRRGVWGSWRSSVPPRGVWAAPVGAEGER